MKKWLVLVLALVMVVSVYAGVANAALPLTKEAGAKKLIVWESADQFEYMKAIAADFKKAHGIDVEVQQVEITEQIAKLPLQKKGTSKNPDVVVFPHDKLGEAVAAKLVIENKAFANLTKSKTGKNSVNAVSYGGKLYGYPKSVESVALIYNKKLVKTPPKTWNDVIALTKNKTLHNPTGTGKNKKYALLWAAGDAYLGYQFFGSQGGYIFGKNGTDPSNIGLASKGAIANLKKYKEIRNALFPKDTKAASFSWDVANALFSSGQAAMTINGPWQIKAFQDAKIDVGVAKLPAYSASAPGVSFGGIRAYYVSSKAQYPRAAQIFAHFATEQAAQIKLYSMKKMIPATTSAANSLTVKKDPIISGFAQQYANSQPMPNIPAMGNYWGAAGTALASLFDNATQTPEKAAAGAKKQVTDAVNKK